MGDSLENHTWICLDSSGNALVRNLHHDLLGIYGAG